MILHIIPDSVFTDFVINKLNCLDPNNHKFLVYVNGNVKKPLVHTKTINLHIINSKNVLLSSFINSLVEYEAVVVHGMFYKHVKKMIMKSSNQIKFVWLGWGGDYYDTIPELSKNLYFNKTLENLQSDYKLTLKNTIKSLIDFFVPSYNIKTSDIYNRIDFFGPVLYDEYVLLEKILKPIHCTYIPFSYGQLENDLIKGIENYKLNGNNILLGNSASYTNNHIEMLELLSNFDLKDRRVITPLNYGDKSYTKKIMSYGQMLLSQNFNPIVDFMDKQNYHKMLSSCSICIMNHKRQQSLGNIITMLYLGAKLFLNQENPVYVFLKKEGAVIYSIDELDFNSKIVEQLSENEIKINKTVLERHWGEESVNKKFMDFIKMLKT